MPSQSASTACGIYAPANVDDTYRDDSPVEASGEGYLERPLLPHHRDDNDSFSPPRRPSSAASNTSIYDLPVTPDSVPWPRYIRTTIRNSTEKALDTWRAMTTLQRVLVVAVFIVCAAGGMTIVILSKHLMHWIVPKAHQWEQTWTSYIILGMMTFTVSFPPLIGWATIGTFAGFILGVWKGWLVYTTATILGSTACVYASRTILRRLVSRLVEHDTRFAALSLTLKYDGLKLLCMIRLCPLPYSVCNGAIATFDTVHPLMYGLATFLVSPKLMVTVFIGSRLRVLMEEGEEMSAFAKAINITSIVVTIAIGVGTAMYIYRSTLARAKELQDAERDALRQERYASASSVTAAGVDGGLPSPGSFARAPFKTSTFHHDEERMVGFHDVDDGDDDDDHTVIPDVDARSTFTTHEEEDVFDVGDGDGDIGGDHGDIAGRRESFRLHTRIKSGQKQ
ncbi:Transmembrane protein 64 [Ascosphaera aggregata]|nr:Transmembrane protein 64 [Ascosphaera aggregata]